MYVSLYVSRAATMYQCLMIYIVVVFFWSFLYGAHVINNRTGSCALIDTLFPCWTGVHEVMTYNE